MECQGGLVDTDKDGVKEAVWVDDVANAEILKSDKEGHFEIAGLAEGEYSLEETSTNWLPKINRRYCI